MIKLTVEIKDEIFSYEYEVGDSKHSSTRKISPDCLSRFVALLSHCNQYSEYEDKQWERKALEEAWKREKQP